jgi:hypothetical protein
LETENLILGSNYALCLLSEACTEKGGEIKTKYGIIKTDKHYTNTLTIGCYKPSEEHYLRTAKRLKTERLQVVMPFEEGFEKEMSNSVHIAVKRLYN